MNNIKEKYELNNNNTFKPILFDIHGTNGVYALCGLFKENRQLSVLIESLYNDNQVNDKGPYVKSDVLYLFEDNTLKDRTRVMYIRVPFVEYHHELLDGTTHEELIKKYTNRQITDLFKFLSSWDVVGYLTVRATPWSIDDICEEITRGCSMSLYLSGHVLRYHPEGVRYLTSVLMSVSSLKQLSYDSEYYDTYNSTALCGMAEVYNKLDKTTKSDFVVLPKDSYLRILGVYHYPVKPAVLPIVESEGIGKTYRLNNHEVITLAELKSTDYGDIYWITLDDRRYNIVGEYLPGGEGYPHSARMYDIEKELT